MKTIKLLLILTAITAVICLSLSGCFLSDLANSILPNIDDSESTPGNPESGNQENDENPENSNDNGSDADNNSSGSEPGGNDESTPPGEDNDSASTHTPIPAYVNQILTSGDYVEQEVLARLELGSDINEVVKELNGEVIESLPEISVFRISLPQELSVADAIEILSKNEFVVYAEPNGLYYLFDTPDDSNYHCQWAPQLTNAEAAWDIGHTGSGVTIAIVDTGVDGTHDDLTGRVIAGFDTYNNVDIAAGDDSSTKDHGTHCAGIAAAKGNNGKGMAGVAWDAYIMPIRIVEDVYPYPISSIHDTAQGIIWAADYYADIISCSFGGPGYSQTMKDAIDYVVSSGCVVFAAMGNSSTTELMYPAGYQGVIAVGSTNAHDEIADSSTTGNHISICAPGVEIYSTVPGGYAYKSGTSMACPFAAGAAALLLQNEWLTPYEVKTRLENSAVDLGPADFDSTYGYGRIDIESALNNNDNSNYGRVDVYVFWKELITLNIENASVILWQNDEVVATSSTNADGHAVFNYVPAGDYQVSASHKLYYSSLAEDNPITVNAGETTDHDIRLEMRP